MPKIDGIPNPLLKIDEFLGTHANVVPGLVGVAAAYISVGGSFFMPLEWMAR